VKPFGLPAQAAVGFFTATGRSCAVSTVRRNDFVMWFAFARAGGQSGRNTN